MARQVMEPVVVAPTYIIRSRIACLDLPDINPSNNVSEISRRQFRHKSKDKHQSQYETHGREFVETVDEEGYNLFQERIMPQWALWNGCLLQL